MRTMRKIRFGFTLVELLIVIIIVAVLAGIAIPKMARATRSAKEAALRQTLRDLRVAQQRYFQLYAGYPNDIEDLTDPNHPTYIWENGEARTTWGSRVYQGAILVQGQELSNVFIKDPVSGENLTTSRLSNGELRIRSSASGNDSRGIAYSSY